MKRFARSLVYGVLAQAFLLGIAGYRHQDEPRGGAPATADALLSEYLDSATTNRATLEKAFAEAAKRDYATLKRDKNEWQFMDASLEEFVFLAFTGEIKLDEVTGDEGLAQLGRYLRERRPHLWEMLHARMQVFYYASKQHQTPARHDLFETVEYLINGPEM